MYGIVFVEYLNRLGKISPLGETSQLMLSKYIQLKHFKKGDYILNYGEVCRHIYFVNKGFIRIFYHKKAKEITEWFANDKQFFFSINSYFKEEPSKLVIEAIEDTDIIQLSKEGYEKLRKQNLEIANLFVVLLSGSLMMSQKRMESIQFETAEQRYMQLLKEQPEILKRAPLQYIATFLGITKETLSRIRAKE